MMDALRVASRRCNGELTLPIAEIIYARSRRLREHADREALSCVEFLEHRYRVVQPADAADDTEAFLDAISAVLSADLPDDIGDADLDMDVPRRTLDGCGTCSSRTRQSA